MRSGGRVALIAAGSMVYPSLTAADILMNDGIESTVINARFIKPLDEALILDLARRMDVIVTVEESALMGGFGSAVLELLAANNLQTPVRTLGVADHFFDHASQNRLRESAGLSPVAISNAAKVILLTVNQESRVPVRS
jgi:1-deoxy-D-xylulose-5-phosphate synthase